MSPKEIIDNKMEYIGKYGNNGLIYKDKSDYYIFDNTYSNMRLVLTYKL